MAAPKSQSWAIAPSGRAILAALAISFVLLNVLYFTSLRPKANVIEKVQAIPGGRVLEAVAIGDNRVLALTSDNRFVLVEDGSVVAETPVDKTVTSLDITADSSKIVGGTSDRDVIIWDAQLNELRRFQVNGRVTSLKVAEDNTVVIGYGVGRFTGRFNVGRFDLQGNPVFTKRVGQDVNAVAVANDLSIYANVSGDVGALGSDGEHVWRGKAVKPLLQMDVTADGHVIGADERGMVYLIDVATGKTIWNQKLSDYRMRMVAYDALSDKIVAGDEDGRLFMLNMDGQLFYQAKASASPIRSFIHTVQDNLFAVSSNGEWIKIDLGLALGAQRQQAINTGWLISNLMLIAAAVTTLTLTVPRLRASAFHTARQIKQSKTAYLLIAPSMILILIFAYVPTVMGLYYSFTNFNLAEPIKFIGLDNFVRVLTKDPFFWVGVGNMVLLLVTGIIKSLTVPLLVAELVFWLRWARVKYWMRVAFIVPSIVPGVVGVLLWKQIYDPQIGLLNETLKALGLGHLTRAWLADANTAIWAIIFAGFPWVGIFAFLIYLGGLLNINHEIFDAAAIDGASAWRRFWDIDLKMIRPQLRLILFFTFLGSVQEYGNIWIMTRGGPGTATYVPGLQMFLQISAAEFGYASAIGFILALVVLVITVWRFRFSQQPDVD
ncbi:MAG: PQQ-binding-like beta-propeller repeat protein [Anaerolineae bacterium]|nr:PQQ-binding-like beta-propeller repeat protein [Candidatus Roseilinea sp.]MDW8450748.1 PQQ-binding-like beta-propeller repeat protein [Anaerolineae bacterium]